MKYEIDFEGCSDDIKCEVFKVALENGNKWYSKRAEECRLKYNRLRINEEGEMLLVTKEKHSFPKISHEDFIAKYGKPKLTLDYPYKMDLGGYRIDVLRDVARICGITEKDILPGPPWRPDQFLIIEKDAVYFTDVTPFTLHHGEMLNPNEFIAKFGKTPAHFREEPGEITEAASNIIRFLMASGHPEPLNVIERVEIEAKEDPVLNLDAPAVTSLADYDFPAKLKWV